MLKDGICTVPQPSVASTAAASLVVVSIINCLPGARLSKYRHVLACKNMCPNVFLWLPFSAKAVSIYRLTGRRELIKRVGLNSAIIHIMGFELIIFYLSTFQNRKISHLIKRASFFLVHFAKMEDSAMYAKFLSQALWIPYSIVEVNIDLFFILASIAFTALILEF